MHISCILLSYFVSGYCMHTSCILLSYFVSGYCMHTSCILLSLVQVIACMVLAYYCLWFRLLHVRFLHTTVFGSGYCMHVSCILLSYFRTFPLTLESQDQPSGLIEPNDVPVSNSDAAGIR